MRKGIKVGNEEGIPEKNEERDACRGGRGGEKWKIATRIRLEVRAGKMQEGECCKDEVQGRVGRTSA